MGKAMKAMKKTKPKGILKKKTQSTKLRNQQKKHCQREQEPCPREQEPCPRAKKPCTRAKNKGPQKASISSKLGPPH